MLKKGFIALIVCAAALAFQSCEKQELSGTSSTFIPVPKKNSTLRILYTAPQSTVCGSVAFPQFDAELAAYDSTEVLMKIAPANFGGGDSDTIFEELAMAFGFIDQFGFITIPKFQTNFDTLLSLPGAVGTHNTGNVVANSAYELSLSSSTITINTTTEFFENTEGDYYLAAYVVVDSIIASQAGHVDDPNTVHRRTLVDIGRPPGYDPQYLGYRITTGTVEVGYKFNLSFEVPRNPAWPDDQISVALVLSTRDDNGRPVFVNANTNH